MVLATFMCVHVVARDCPPPLPCPLHFRQKKTGSERLRNLFHRVSWASLPTKLIIEGEIFLTWTLGCCHLLPFPISKSMATGHHRALLSLCLRASFLQSHLCCVRKHLLLLSLSSQGWRESNPAILRLKLQALLGEGARPWDLFLSRGPLTSHWCWVLSWGALMGAPSSIRGSLCDSSPQGPLTAPFISAPQASEAQDTALLEPKMRHWMRSHTSPPKGQRGSLPLLAWSGWVVCLILLKSL